MIRLIMLFLLLCSWPLLAAASTEIYIYNTTNERLTYSQTFPNGDTKTGEIKESSGSYSDVTLRTNSGGVLTCRITSESGKSTVELKGTDSQVFLLVLKDGAMSVVSGAWTATNGQSQKREIRFLNVTGKPLNFDIIDEKEIRKVSLKDGYPETFPNKSNIKALRFENGQREETPYQPGDFWLIYRDPNSFTPDKIQLRNMGHLTPPISR